MAVAAVAPERALAAAAVDFCIIVLEEKAAVATAASSRSPGGDAAVSAGAIGCAAVSSGSFKTTAGGVAGCASAGVDDAKSSCDFESLPVGTASSVRALLTLSFRSACTGHQKGRRRQQKGARYRNAPAVVLAPHPISLLVNCTSQPLLCFCGLPLQRKLRGRWRRCPPPALGETSSRSHSCFSEQLAAAASFWYHTHFASPSRRSLPAGQIRASRGRARGMQQAPCLGPAAGIAQRAFANVRHDCS